MENLGSSGETRVNSTTARDQTDPAIAALHDGGYVVTWQSYYQDDPGKFGWGIYAQRYSSTGAKVGVETLVNSTVTSDQLGAAITALRGGGYVITWDSSGQDGSDSGVYAQRYDGNGIAAGGEVLVNTITANSQQRTAITALNDGGYVVTWTSDGQDGSSYGIYAQRYDSLGSQVNGEARINSTTESAQFIPAIAALSDGGYVVTWRSSYQDGSDNGVFLQRYGSNGATVGLETLVNSTTANDQTNPAIAALTDGGYVVTWQSYGQDGGGFGVYAQRYSGTGAKVGVETLVNTTTSNDQVDPTIAALDDGGYVIAWASFDQDGSGWGICAQRYDGAGAKAGLETLVNTTTVNDQSRPAITALSDGGYMVTWTSYGIDGSLWGIAAQRFDAHGLREGHLTLTGGAEDNVLRMTSAAEGVELIGGVGADTLAGAAFNDVLTGGTGTDTFEFAANGNGVDTITDWGTGDKITVAGANFSGSVTSGNGTSVAANQVEISTVGGVTTLYISTDAAAGADVVIQLQGSFTVNQFTLQGNEIRANINPAVNHAPTFAPAVGTGKTIIPVGNGNDASNAVALQADGKIVLVGSSVNGSGKDFGVVRLNTDGSLDTSFNATGKLMLPVGSFDDVAISVVVQSDGKIVVGGASGNGSNTDYSVVRLNSDGSLDTAFNATGKLVFPIANADDSIQSIALQADGKIVVAGWSVDGLYKFSIARLNTDGTLDTSFNGSGKLTLLAGTSHDVGESVTLQSDGKIVLAGYNWNGGTNDYSIIRLNTDGSFDTSFDGDGKLILPQ